LEFLKQENSKLKTQLAAEKDFQSLSFLSALFGDSGDYHRHQQKGYRIKDLERQIRELDFEIQELEVELKDRQKRL